jgi:hypothetical protein
LKKIESLKEINHATNKFLFSGSYLISNWATPESQSGHFCQKIIQVVHRNKIIYIFREASIAYGRFKAAFNV